MYDLLKDIFLKLITPVCILFLSLFIYINVNLNNNLYIEINQFIIYFGFILLVVNLVHIFYLDSKYFYKRKNELPKLFKNLIILIIWIIAALFWFVTHSDDLKSYTGIFATSSVMIAIIGFAVRNLVSDFFSGITLGLERSFHIGDWIELEEGVIGKVIEMNWRSTKIATRENIFTIIPNSKLSSITFRNYNMPQRHFRTGLTITLDYKVTSYQVKRILLGAVNEIKELRDFENKPDLRIKEFAPNGVVWELRFWLNSYHELDIYLIDIQQNILRNLHYANICVSPEKISIVKEEKKADEVLELLRKVNIFEDLTTQNIEFLAQHAIKHLYMADDYIIKEEDDGDSLFMVSDGLLKVSVKGKNNQDVEVATLRAGSFFGEIALLTGEKRTSSVQAIVDSMLYEVPKSVMKELLTEHQYIADALSEAITRRQFQNQEKMMNSQNKVNNKEKLIKTNLDRILKFFNLKPMY